MNRLPITQISRSTRSVTVYLTLNCVSRFSKKFIFTKFANFSDRLPDSWTAHRGQLLLLQSLNLSIVASYEATTSKNLTIFTIYQSSSTLINIIFLRGA